jgi:hypothetical protein
MVEKENSIKRKRGEEVTRRFGNSKTRLGYFGELSFGKPLELQTCGP